MFFFVTEISVVTEIFVVTSAIFSGPAQLGLVPAAALLLPSNDSRVEDCHGVDSRMYQGGGQHRGCPLSDGRCTAHHHLQAQAAGSANSCQAVAQPFQVCCYSFDLQCQGRSVLCCRYICIYMQWDG